MKTEENHKFTFLQSKITLQKSNDWSYEKEWRLMCEFEKTLDRKEERCRVKKNPTALYLGCQISDKNRTKLIKIAKEKKIPIYQMFIVDSTQEYEIDYKLIES